MTSATARRLRLKGGKDGGATAPGEGQAARQAVPSLAHLVTPLAPVRFPPKSLLGGDRPACRPSTSPLTGSAQRCSSGTGGLGFGNSWADRSIKLEKRSPESNYWLSKKLREIIWEKLSNSDKPKSFISCKVFLYFPINSKIRPL